MDVSYKLFFIVCMVLLALSSIDAESAQDNIKPTERKARINVVRRPKLSFLQFMAPLAVADSCRSAAGLEGTCLSGQDCLKRGGRGLETCAWGLGVCCVHTSTCGAETSANMTYFVSPNYPNPWTSNSGVCTFIVKPRLFSKICQLRLDFEDFYIKGPTSGVCETDSFVASGQDLNNIVPRICGLNSGQHMYLQVGSSSGPYRFTVTTFEESTERKWKIRITQIPCGSNALAPPQCLQYFTGSVGSFQSFNFGNVKPLENTYFQNMDYTICIRKEAAMCGATFTSDGNFNVNIAENSLTRCAEDYISFGTERKCGNRAAVATPIKYGNAGPMVITFVSDQKTTVDSTNGDSGFSFRYSQFSCSSRN